jgi:hypothetical protein
LLRHGNFVPFLPLVTFRYQKLRGMFCRHFSRVSYRNKGQMNFTFCYYEGVSRSFRTGRLERELQMVQLSATRCSCIAILRVSLVSFATIPLRVAFQRVFIVVVVVVVVISLSTQSGNFWIHPHRGLLVETAQL